MIAVVYQSGQWLYDNNSVLTPFDPAADDCLLAELDFTNDTVVSLEGTSAIVNGIDSGYVTGDLVITANELRGSLNNGEFGVSGTRVVNE